MATGGAVIGDRAMGAGTRPCGAGWAGALAGTWAAARAAGAIVNAENESQSVIRARIGGNFLIFEREAGSPEPSITLLPITPDE
jgi:hypothetical protein